MRYKEVPIKPRAKLTKELEAVMSNFLSAFDNHIYLKKKSPSDLLLGVDLLDLNQFKSAAADLKLAHESEKTTMLIDDIVAALEGIGSYGISNGKRNYVDYNKERKVKNRKEKEEKRSAKSNGAIVVNSKNNLLPKKYENKIICADSLKLLKKMPDNCIDLMLTSPPYNFGLSYETGEDDKKWDKYFSQLFAILKETKRVLKSGGRMIINVQPLFSDYIPTHHIVSKFLMDIGMLWKGEIIWEKNNYNCKYTSWGSWKSPSSPYLKYTWEFIEVFCKDNLKHQGSSDDADISADEFKKWVLAKWSMAPEKDMKKYDHPAMFPEQLVERCLKLFSFRNDVVLDVFNGAGTTTAVAKKLERRYLGLDISRKYCAVAKQRIDNIQDIQTGLL